MLVKVPIIMSPPMAWSLLRETEEPGTGKTNTRRFAWRDDHRPTFWKVICDDLKAGKITEVQVWVKETHYRFGLWVRDGLTATGQTRWRFRPANDDVRFDLEGVPVTLTGSRRGSPTRQWWKRPSIFMPMVCSRLTLEVRSMRLEQLHQISATDAEAEGVEMETADPPFWYVPGLHPHSITAVGIEEPGPHHWSIRSYAKLWDHLHGAGAWDKNPEVVVIDFAPRLCNIEAVAA